MRSETIFWKVSDAEKAGLRMRAFSMKYTKYLKNIVIILFLALLIIVIEKNNLYDYVYKEYFVRIQEVFTELNQPIVENKIFESTFVKVFTSSEIQKEFHHLNLHVKVLNILDIFGRKIRTSNINQTHVDINNLFASMENWEMKNENEKKVAFLTFYMDVFPIDTELINND